MRFDFFDQAADQGITGRIEGIEGIEEGVERGQYKGGQAQNVSQNSIQPLKNLFSREQGSSF